METKEYNEAEAKAYILNCFREQGDFAEITDEKTLGEIVGALKRRAPALLIVDDLDQMTSGERGKVLVVPSGF